MRGIILIKNSACIITLVRSDFFLEILVIFISLTREQMQIQKTIYLTVIITALSIYIKKKIGGRFCSNHCTKMANIFNTDYPSV